MRATTTCAFAAATLVACVDTPTRPSTTRDTGSTNTTKDTGLADMGTALRDMGVTMVDSGSAVDTGAGTPDTGAEMDAGNPACTYPPHNPNAFVLNQGIAPFSWPEAKDAQGNTFPLSLTDAFCNTDPNIDWSPHDMILFVSWVEW